MRKKIFCLLAIVIFLVQGEAKAYTFTTDFNRGFYWQSFPVSFSKFVTSQSDGDVLASLVSLAEGTW